MARVLLIQDLAGRESGRELQGALEARGHRVGAVPSDAVTRADTAQADVVIIDAGTEPAAGRHITAVLRRVDPRVGIVLLTPEGAGTQARIAGLGCGADFCEARPVRFDLLCAYVEVIVRRLLPDAWSLDTTARMLRAPRCEELVINDKELTLLKLLAGRVPHAADRSAIARAYGKDWLCFDERVLEKIVSRLRRKWREGAMCDLPLKTVHGVGYCFTEKILVC